MTTELKKGKDKLLTQEEEKEEALNQKITKCEQLLHSTHKNKKKRLFKLEKIYQVLLTNRTAFVRILFCFCFSLFDIFILLWNCV